MWHSKRRLTEVVFLIRNKRSLQGNTCHVKQCSGWLLENRNPDSSQVSVLMDKKEGIRNASRKVPISYWEKICWRVEHVAQRDCEVSVLEDIQNSTRQSSEQSDLLTLKLSCLEQRVELADLQTIFNKILSFCEILAVPEMRILWKCEKFFRTASFADLVSMCVSSKHWKFLHVCLLYCRNLHWSFVLCDAVISAPFLREVIKTELWSRFPTI